MYGGNGLMETDRREYKRKYYLENKERWRSWEKKNRVRLSKAKLARAQKRYNEVKAWVHDCISLICCPDCGFSFSEFPNAADFHHVEERERGLHVLMRNGSAERFFNEVSKGEFLCPTCHVIRHIKLGTGRTTQQKRVGGG
jgi:hypothetical protein